MDSVLPFDALHSCIVSCDIIMDDVLLLLLVVVELVPLPNSFIMPEKKPLVLLEVVLEEVSCCFRSFSSCSN